MSAPARQTVDLSRYPDLVVVYLGMRVRRLRGILTLLGLGPQHEAYFARGGIDAVYLGVGRPTGLAAFAPEVPARGAMFSGRRRAGRTEEPLAPVVSEDEAYSR